MIVESIISAHQIEALHECLLMVMVNRKKQIVLREILVDLFSFFLFEVQHFSLSKDLVNDGQCCNNALVCSFRIKAAPAEIRAISRTFVARFGLYL